VVSLQEYRLYQLTRNGRIVRPPEEFSAPSDEAAVNYAASKNIPDGCEVWQRDRLVAHIKREKAE
jgi:hypothetical protein